jgi:predicted Fe-S protein YdhL (DUF1289 family)
MTDEIWCRDEIDSPCVKICVIHPRADICIGCFRTAVEIAAWPALSPDARRALMAELPKREALLQVRTGRRRRTDIAK